MIKLIAILPIIMSTVTHSFELLPIQPKNRYEFKSQSIVQYSNDKNRWGGRNKLIIKKTCASGNSKVIFKTTWRFKDSKTIAYYRGDRISKHIPSSGKINPDLNEITLTRVRHQFKYLSNSSIVVIGFVAIDNKAQSSVFDLSGVSEQFNKLCTSNNYDIMKGRLY